jgi:hypothetical protein
MGARRTTPLVTPAQAGVQGADGLLAALDSRFRGNDEKKKQSGSPSCPQTMNAD